MAITYKRDPIGTAIDSILELVTTIKQQELAQANQLNAMLYQDAKEEKRSVQREYKALEGTYQKTMGSLDGLDDIYKSDTNKVDVLDNLNKEKLNTLNQLRTNTEAKTEEIIRRKDILSSAIGDLGKAASFRSSGGSGPGTVGLPDVYEAGDIGYDAFRKLVDKGDVSVTNINLVKKYFKTIGPITDFGALEALNLGALNKELKLAQREDQQYLTESRATVTAIKNTYINFNSKFQQVLNQDVNGEDPIVDTWWSDKTGTEKTIYHDYANMMFVRNFPGDEKKEFTYMARMKDLRDNADEWIRYRDFYGIDYKEAQDVMDHLTSMMKDISYELGKDIAIMSGVDRRKFKDGAGKDVASDAFTDYRNAWQLIKPHFQGGSITSTGDYSQLQDQFGGIILELNEIEDDMAAAGISDAKLKQLTNKRNEILQLTKNYFDQDFSDKKNRMDIINNLSQITNHLMFVGFQNPNTLSPSPQLSTGGNPYIND